MNLGLAKKRAIVTGGSKGIGRAIVTTLANEGADVSFCARTPDAVAETVAELAETGVTAIGRSVDVADADALSAWIDEAARELGGIDIVVANVSAQAFVGGEESWNRTFDVDLMHTVRAIERARPFLAGSPAAGVVLVSSSSYAMAAQTSPQGRAYGALKAALVSYGSQMAHELATDGVRVNTVSPGAVLFPEGVWDRIRRSDPERFARTERAAALGRYGSPEEIARAVVFLASPAASYITGANLRVDGGVLTHPHY